MTTPLDSALALAAAGFPTFPVYGIVEGRCSCRKPECGWSPERGGNAGKHPRTRRGFKDAATDETTIRAWWSDAPESNVGLVTGNGLIVLDADPRHGGYKSLEALEEQHGSLPTTPVCLTGGGGLHVYFSLPQGMKARNSAGKLAPGLDVRADGGYVVAPPSVHPSGSLYAWAEGRGLDCPLALAPSWLLEWLAEPAGAAKAARPAREWAASVAAGAPEGKRNHSLASLAGYLLRVRSLDPRITRELLLAWATARCTPPMPESEAMTVIDSIARRELRRSKGGRHVR